MRKHIKKKSGMHIMAKNVNNKTGLSFRERQFLLGILEFNIIV